MSHFSKRGSDERPATKLFFAARVLALASDIVYKKLAGATGRAASEANVNFVNFAILLLTAIGRWVILITFDSASSLFRPHCFASRGQWGFFTDPS
jgi:hypothetical protein